MSESTQIAAPMDFKAMMMAAAQEAMAQEKPDNKFISFKSGVLQYDGNAVPGNKLDVVIVATCYENQLFPDRYDPNKIVSPACYALGHKDAELAPVPEDCTKAYHTDCATCPANEWESDPNGGKGKFCKNTRRLAIVTANSLGDLEKADVLYARLPVTSVANWSKYVTQIGNVVKRPPFGVVTELSVIPDAKSQFKVCFTFKSMVDDEVLEQVFAIHEQQQKAILFGYPKNAPEAEEPAKPAAKGKGKY